MLFEMATDNMSFRIIESSGDSVDEIAIMLNRIAKNLYNSILESGFVNPYYTYQNLTQITLIP